MQHFYYFFCKRAIVDVELLSKCNEMIITGASTYGMVAAMKSLRMPLYVNGNGFDMKKCARLNLGTPPAVYGNNHYYASY